MRWLQWRLNGCLLNNLYQAIQAATKSIYIWMRSHKKNTSRASISLNCSNSNGKIESMIFWQAGSEREKENAMEKKCIKWQKI